MGKKITDYSKDFAVGISSSLAGGAIWSYISQKHNSVADITIGSIWQFMILNSVPIIFIGVSAIAIRIALRSTSKEDLDAKFDEYKKQADEFIKQKTDSIELLKKELAIHKYLLIIRNDIKYEVHPGATPNTFRIVRKLDYEEYTGIASERIVLNKYLKNTYGASEADNMEDKFYKTIDLNL